MNKNQIIRYAIIVCYILIGVILLLGLIFTIGLTHSYFYPEKYSHFIITDLFNAGWGIGDIQLCKECIGPKDIILSEINPMMRGWLWIRFMAFAILTIVIVFRILGILKSVLSLNTFYNENILHFKRLAWYGLLAFLLSSFNFYMTSGETMLHFNLNLGTIGFAMACLVLSEIFKEGKVLQEDNKAII